MRVVRTEVDFDAEAAAAIANPLREALRQKSRASLALSGGTSPWPALERLSAADLDWRRVDIYQVDERVAPAGDPARNATGLRVVLIDRVPATFHPMPVEAANLEYGARQYAAILPEVLDVVHLGIGDDGHTASLVPGDPVLDVSDRQVASTGPYRGHRRMTLTFPALNEAETIVWIVRGDGKASMVRRLVEADPEIPAGRVAQARAVVVTDVGATS